MSSSHKAPPASWLLPLLTFLQEAETRLSFFQDCSLHALLALLHIPLLQEVHHDFPPPRGWLLNSCPTPSLAR